MATSFTEDGYTKQQAKAIHQTLIDQHLKSDANWPDIFSNITTLMIDVCGGHSHPDTVLFPGRIQKRLAAMSARLEAAMQAHEHLGERLQWHLDDQCRQLYTIESGGKEWAALASKQTGKHVCPTTVTRRSLFGDILNAALLAVRQAQERPVHSMISYVQKKGAPKNHAMRLIVTELLEIFERATGIEPIVSAKSLMTVQRYHHGKTFEYRGNAYPFLLACLTPAFPAQELGAAILTAYKEARPTWKKQFEDQRKELNPAFKPATRRKK